MCIWKVVVCDVCACVYVFIYVCIVCMYVCIHVYVSCVCLQVGVSFGVVVVVEGSYEVENWLEIY